MKQIFLAFGLMIAVCNPVHAAETTYQQITRMEAKDDYNRLLITDYNQSCVPGDDGFFLIEKRDSLLFALAYSAFKKDIKVRFRYACRGANKDTAIVTGVRVIKK